MKWELKGDVVEVVDVPFRTKHTISQAAQIWYPVRYPYESAGYQHFSLASRGPWLFRASYGDGRASAKPSHSFAIASRSSPS